MRVPSGVSRRRFSLSVAAWAALAAGCMPEDDPGEFIQVNGDTQWLLVAGDAPRRPTLLMLHGGPGASQTVLFRHFNRALENSLRVAYWDQRGAGRSYRPEHPPPHMTVDQFVRDLDVVVRLLRERHGAPVFLLGHSWGSALGLLYARRHPDAVAGTIGVGQVADQGAQEAASHAWALQEARRRGDTRAEAELTRIGQPPFDVPELMVKNRWVEEFGGTFAPGFRKTKALMQALLGGETTIAEVRRIIAANMFSLKAMWPEVRTLDLPARVPRIDVPAAFILGRHDRQCPSPLAEAYVGGLPSPAKEIVWFERSAHNPPFEEPERFNATVLRIIHGWAPGRAG